MELDKNPYSYLAETATVEYIETLKDLVKDFANSFANKKRNIKKEIRMNEMQEEFYSIVELVEKQRAFHEKVEAYRQAITQCEHEIMKLDAEVGSKLTEFATKDWAGIIESAENESLADLREKLTGSRERPNLPETVEEIFRDEKE